MNNQLINPLIFGRPDKPIAVRHRLWNAAKKCGRLMETNGLSKATAKGPVKLPYLDRPLNQELEKGLKLFGQFKIRIVEE